ncbi:MAG: hypothetical protein D6743_14525 [Calditrichaeota bacterium]|nr:MAG: hypothetical protein D6743_14525 [Calditrichota bacterium]
MSGAKTNRPKNQRTRGGQSNKPDSSAPPSKNSEGAKLGDLNQKLADAKAKLKEVEARLHAQTEENQRLRTEVEACKTQRQQFQEECDTLSRKIQALEKNAAKELAKVKRNLRETERQLNNERAEHEALRAQMEELQTSVQSAEPPGEPAESVSANTATFQIYINLEGTNYRGKIQHHLSKDTLKFSGLRFSEMTDFIEAHLPRPEKVDSQAQPLAQDEVPETEVTDVSTAIPLESDSARKRVSEPGGLYDVALRQSGRSVTTSDPIRPAQAFALDVKLHFDEIARLSALVQDHFSFQVDVVARRAGQEVITRTGLADEVPANTREYACSIDLPGLDAGDYELDLVTVVPEVQFSSRQRVGLVVAEG